MKALIARLKTSITKNLKKLKNQMIGFAATQAYVFIAMLLVVILATSTTFMWAGAVEFLLVTVMFVWWALVRTGFVEPSDTEE